MKPTLTWENGTCTNAPPGWRIVVTDNGEAWSWSAAYAGDQHTAFGMASQAAAQLACEAALWRLGVMPLPEWSGPHSLRECMCIGHVNGDAGFRAQVSRCGPRWRVVWVRCGDVDLTARALARGSVFGHATRPAAERAAESVLRVLLAEQLEAEVVRREAKP